MPATSLSEQKTEPRIAEMRIDRINILNFKNIADAELQFAPRVNCLLGHNGMGKSNLLDAIHYVCTGRPVSGLRDTELMRHGSQAMMVKAALDSQGTSHEVNIGLHAGRRKTLRLDAKECPRLSDYIGRFPVVALTPADTMLLTGAAEERRRFTDRTLSLTDRAYLDALTRCARALDARNKMLRAGIRDHILYESVETPLAAAMQAVHDKRKAWIETIAPLFAEYYSAISGNAEHAGLSYISALDAMNPADILLRNAERDRTLGYTSSGTHRDDLGATLDGHDMRRLGSQGQMKTFVTALRLAVFDYLKQHSAVTPLLLLDDIFDKLDAGRVERIMQQVSRREMFGQIFVTDTNRSHLDIILAHLGGDHAIFSVNNGVFTRINN